jgi:hypothetical protein
MSDVVTTPSPAPGLRQLDGLARELTGWGWCVRFESYSFAPGARGGHLVLTRPLASAAEYVVARPRRHEVHVWVRSGDAVGRLGTVVDVDEVHDLLRREIRAAGYPRRPRRAAE